MKYFLSSTFFCILLIFNALFVYGAAEEPQAIPRFDIISFNVEGNTLLQKAEVDSILASFTGKQKDFGTVQEAIDALESAYHQHGFTTIQIILPEQELENGIIRLVISEIHIASVKIEGNKFFSEQNIRRSIPSLKEGVAPNINKISASLKVANENPAKKVSMQLENSDKENEVNALLKVVDEKQWKVTLTADNTGNRDTGESRTGVVLQHANVFNRDNVLSLQYTTSPEKIDKVTIFGFGYHIPVYSFGDSIDFFASYSDVDSGTIFAGTTDIKVSGRGSSFGTRYNQNLMRIGTYEHKLSYGIDYRKYISNATLLSTIPMDSDVIVHPVSLNYAGTLQFTGGEAGFNLSLVHNIPGGAKGSDEDFQRVRGVAKSDYTIIRYGANFGYVLPLDMQFRFIFSGQYTNNSLVSGEQFGIGGANSVRGFQEREASDDIGNSGSIELYSPDIFKLMKIDKAQVRMLVFYDAGQVAKVGTLPGEEGSTAISSAGFGVRVAWDKNFNLSADYGYALGVEGSRAVRNNRFHLMAMYSF